MCWSVLLLPYSWLPLDKVGGELAKYQPKGERERERERRVMVLKIGAGKQDVTGENCVHCVYIYQHCVFLPLGTKLALLKTENEHSKSKPGLFQQNIVILNN